MVGAGIEASEPFVSMTWEARGTYGTIQWWDWRRRTGKIVTKYQAKSGSTRMMEGKGVVEFEVKGGIECGIKRGSGSLGKIRPEGSKIQLSKDKGKGSGAKVSDGVRGSHLVRMRRERQW